MSHYCSGNVPGASTFKDDFSDGLDKPATLTPEAEALIEAAVVFRSRYSNASEEPWRSFFSAVDAYKASQQPKGVRPEELEPGTRYKDPVSQTICKTVVLPDGSIGGLDGCNVFRFEPDFRIIPIQDQE